MKEGIIWKLIFIFNNNDANKRASQSLFSSNIIKNLLQKITPQPESWEETLARRSSFDQFNASLIISFILFVKIIDKN